MLVMDTDARAATEAATAVRTRGGGLHTCRFSTEKLVFLNIWEENFDVLGWGG